MARVISPPTNSAGAVRARQPELPLLLSCNTPAGRAAAGDPFDAVHYLPLDRPRVVRRVLGRVAPALYVFVETEIWPVLLLELARARVPAAMVNARISDRSFPRYRLAGSLIRPALSTLAAVCARDETSRSRLVSLGARDEATTVCGDLKVDAAPSRAACDRDLASSTEAPVLMAASVRPAEIEPVIDAYRRTRVGHANARLVLAPRYIDDADEAEAAAGAAGLRTARRSHAAARGGARDWDVLILDTHGELADMYAECLGAFVGGTLDGTGGHSVVEPAAAGVPVVVGPALADVREHASALERRGALVVVDGVEALARTWGEWLDDDAAASRAGAAGRAYVAEAGGALERTLEVLGPLLDAAARTPRRAAELER